MESLGSPAAPPRPTTEGSGSSPTALVPPPYHGPLPTPSASAVTSVPNGATPVPAFGSDDALIPPTVTAPVTAPTDVGPSDPVVQLSGVGHRFGANDALRDLSFEVPDGAITVLLGPNGAGKTTAIRAITGALAPMWGTVRTFGLDPDDDGHLVRPRCGVVSAKPALYDRLSGRDNLAYAAELYGVGADAADRIERCATRFGIEDALDQLVGGYSTGMKTRLALARSVLHDPQLLLYDEPTSGLDPVISRTIDDLIRRLQKDLGVTSVVVTHDMISALTVGDRIAMLDQGSVLECSVPRDFLNSAHPVVRGFLDSQHIGRNFFNEMENFK